MKVVLFGNNERGVRCLEALSSSNYDVTLVVADPGSPEEGYYRSVRPAADSLGLAVIEPEDINSDSAVETLEGLRADIGVLVGYGRLVGPRVRKAFDHGCINLHASPLPHYRGAGTLNWQIINGETSGAISIIQVDAGIDTGDILAQQSFEIGSDESIADVAETVNALYPALLLDTLDVIAVGAEERVVQDPSRGSYYAKRYPRDGLIRWESMSAEAVHNMIRALTRPYPGAFTFLGPEKLFLWKSELMETNYHGPPGRVIALRDGGAAVLAAADRGVLITHVETGQSPEGSPRQLGMRAGDDLISQPG